MANLDFDGNLAFEHIRQLSSVVGPRWIGSENGKRAAAYIRDYFTHIGLPVEEQAFDARGFILHEHHLEILDPPLGKIASVPILGSPDTAAEGISGEIIYVEGSDSSICGEHLRGKIVLWSPSFRGYLMKEMAQFKPLAVIIISADPGASPRHDVQPAGFLTPLEGVTTFRISWENGYKLVQAGIKKARLVLRSQPYESKGTNLIAEVKGSLHPEEIIFIGAHYDSPPDNPGATDNASGTSIVLELARIYAQRGSQRTLRFAAWDGEEAGYMGSFHYLKELKKLDKIEREEPHFKVGLDKTTFERHLLCINMDVLGMALGIDACYVSGPTDLANTVKVLGKELGIPHLVKEDDMYGSDGDPASLAGIPSLTFARMGPAFAYIHTDQDTLDLIHPQHLQQVGKLIDVFLTRTAAQAYSWPFERIVPERQMKMLQDRMKQWLGAIPPL